MTKLITGFERINFPVYSETKRSLVGLSVAEYSKSKNAYFEIWNKNITFIYDCKVLVSMQILVIGGT